MLVLVVFVFMMVSVVSVSVSILVLVLLFLLLVPSFLFLLLSVLLILHRKNVSNCSICNADSVIKIYSPLVKHFPFHFTHVPVVCVCVRAHCMGVYRCSRKKTVTRCVVL